MALRTPRLAASYCPLGTLDGVPRKEEMASSGLGPTSVDTAKPEEKKRASSHSLGSPNARISKGTVANSSAPNKLLPLHSTRPPASSVGLPPANAPSTAREKKG